MGGPSRRDRRVWQAGLRPAWGHVALRPQRERVSALKGSHTPSLLGPEQQPPASCRVFSPMWYVQAAALLWAAILEDFS